MNIKNLIERLRDYELSTGYYEATQIAADALEELSKQLAEKDAEINRLESDALYYLANERALIEQLAASQVVNQKLRKVLGAVDDSGLLVGQYVIHERLNDLVKGAIYDTPNDTTALNEVIQRTAEKVKEMCAEAAYEFWANQQDSNNESAQTAIRTLDVSKIGE